MLWKRKKDMFYFKVLSKYSTRNHVCIRFVRMLKQIKNIYIYMYFFNICMLMNIYIYIKGSTLFSPWLFRDDPSTSDVILLWKKHWKYIQKTKKHVKTNSPPQGPTFYIYFQIHRYKHVYIYIYKYLDSPKTLNT
jgi:hypothetical protein